MAKEYVKNYLAEMQKIKDSLMNIQTVIRDLPACSWSDSLTISNANYLKKVDAFLAVNPTLTEAQKEAIERIKKGEIPAFSAAMEAAVAPEETVKTEVVSGGKKGGKKH
jgi:hypothetical protein